MGMSAVSGLYEREEGVENNWHKGIVSFLGNDNWCWRNEEGILWTITLSGIQEDDIEAGSSFEGKENDDSPDGAGGIFKIEADEDGNVFITIAEERFCRIGDALNAGANVKALAFLKRNEVSIVGVRGSYLEILEAFLTAESCFISGDMEGFASAVNSIFEKVPIGSPEWTKSDHTLFFSGHPPFYSALRTMYQMINLQVPHPKAFPDTEFNLTIVTCARTLTNTADTLQEHLAGKTNPNRILHLDPRILVTSEKSRSKAEDIYVRGGNEFEHVVFDSNVPDVFRSSLFWWTGWLYAAGGMRVHVRFVLLDTECISVPDSNDPGTVENVSFNIDADKVMQEHIFKETDYMEIVDLTDQYLFVYPHPCGPKGWETCDTVTGCATASPNDLSMLITDDLWLLRTPKHLNILQAYNSHVRAAYFCQWMMHETSHCLFNGPRYFMHCNLEGESGHTWFDRSNWPDDFESESDDEVDYFFEALNRRYLDNDYTEGLPLIARLKRALPMPPVFESGSGDLSGEYVRNDAENDWHYVSISRDESGKYTWSNRAGDSWELLQLDFESPSTLYFKTSGDSEDVNVRFVPVFSENGETVERFIIYFTYQNEEYRETEERNWE